MTAPIAADRYSRIAVALHWAVAALIGFNLTLGWFMETFASPVRMIAVPLHVSCGLSVLALTVLRIAWRLVVPPPPLPHVAGLERAAAHVAHFLLYLGMVLMPVTGWAILSAHPAPGTSGFAAERVAMADKAPPPGPGIVAWWVLPVPSIAIVQEIGGTAGGLPAQQRLHDRFRAWHGAGGWVMLALLLAHVLGALKHQLVDRQPFIRRMTWAGK